MIEKIKNDIVKTKNIKNTINRFLNVPNKTEIFVISNIGPTTINPKTEFAGIILTNDLAIKEFEVEHTEMKNAAINITNTESILMLFICIYTYFGINTCKHAEIKAPTTI